MCTICSLLSEWIIIVYEKWVILNYIMATTCYFLWDDSNACFCQTNTSSSIFKSWLRSTGRSCRSTRTHHSDSRRTSLCTYCLMLNVLRREATNINYLVYSLNARASSSRSTALETKLLTINRGAWFLNLLNEGPVNRTSWYTCIWRPVHSELFTVESYRFYIYYHVWRFPFVSSVLNIKNENWNFFIHNLRTIYM
jgi:hypothetical protein